MLDIKKYTKIYHHDLSIYKCRVHRENLRFSHSSMDVNSIQVEYQEIYWDLFISKFIRKLRYSEITAYSPFLLHLSTGSQLYLMMLFRLKKMDEYKEMDNGQTESAKTKRNIVIQTDKERDSGIQRKRQQKRETDK